MKRYTEKFWHYINGMNGLITSAYVALVFSAAMYINAVNPVDGADKYDNSWVAFVFRNFLLITVLSLLICPQIMRLLSARSLLRKAYDKKREKQLKLAFYVVPFCVLLVHYIIYYPGGFSFDSFVQYTQALTGEYVDWHPPFHTLFAFKLPLLLTGNWLGSIVLFQIILFSLALGYMLSVMLKYSNARFCVAALLLFMLNPQTVNMLMYPWKDVSFAIGAMLLTSFSAEIYFTHGEWIKKPVNMAFFILAAAAVTLFRNNAVLFTVPLIIAVLFYVVRKRGIVIVLCVAALVGGVKYPLYSAMNVQTPEAHQIETLGVPLNIIGAVAVNRPEVLDDEGKALVERIAPQETWERYYVYGSFNDVKTRSDAFNAVEVFGTKRVLSVTFKCITKAPKESFTALIKLTEPVYTVTSNYLTGNIPYVFDNDYGIRQSGIPVLQRVNYLYSGAFKLLFPHLFVYTGAMHMLLLFVALSKLKLNKKAAWKKILLTLPLFVYNYGTMLLLTGAEDCSRFFYYTFLITPLLLILLLNKGEAENEAPSAGNQI